MSTVGLNEATIAKYIREQNRTSPRTLSVKSMRIRSAGSDCRPVSTGDTGQKQLVGPERSEGRRLRRWPASKGYTLKSKPPLCGWSDYCDSGFRSALSYGKSAKAFVTGPRTVNAALEPREGFIHAEKADAQAIGIGHAFCGLAIAPITFGARPAAPWALCPSRRGDRCARVRGAVVPRAREAGGTRWRLCCSGRTLCR